MMMALYADMMLTRNLISPTYVLRVMIRCARTHLAPCAKHGLTLCTLIQLIVWERDHEV
jgi:hypothetical protein